MKCHKDHVDREEACITMCNGKSDGKHRFPGDVLYNQKGSARNNLFS